MVRKDLSECDKSCQVKREKDQSCEGLEAKPAGQRQEWIALLIIYSDVLERPGSRQCGNHHETILMSVVLCRREIKCA